MESPPLSRLETDIYDKIRESRNMRYFTPVPCSFIHNYSENCAKIVAAGLSCASIRILFCLLKCKNSTAGGTNVHFFLMCAVHDLRELSMDMICFLKTKKNSNYDSN